MRPASTAFTMASKFEPRPEARTPMRSRSGIDHRASPGFDLAHIEDALAGLPEEGGGALGIGGPDHEQVAQSHVEDPTHLGLLHPARLLEDAENGGHGPGARVDEGLALLGEHAGQVLRDTAARDMG